MQRLTRAISILAATLTVLLTIAAVDFQRRLLPSKASTRASQAAVFTGQYDRISHALMLLNSGKVQRLLISGVNDGAGLSPERLVALFKHEAPWLNAAIAEGRVELDTISQNTFENARETACWYHRRNLSGPLLLITSIAHMARASVALEFELTDVEIQRDHVPSPRQTKLWLHEFPRYVATRLLLLNLARRSPSCVKKSTSKLTPDAFRPILML